MTVQFYSDEAVTSAGFLASWKAIPVDQEIAELKPDLKKGYLLSFPQSFSTSDENLEENVCLQMFNVAATGSVQVGLYSPENIIEGEPTSKGEFQHNAEENHVVQCLKLSLPSDFVKGSAILKINGSFDDDYKFVSYKSVRALHLEPMFLVQTDKSDYRPKQKVFFRILALNYELKPSKVTQIPEIWITDPSDARLAQWKNVDLQNGLAQLEMELSDEPLLGSWTIHVKHDEGQDPQKSTFLVSENVLPKFEVKITPPTMLIRDSEFHNFTVCAKYTHGESVKGLLNVTFFSEFKAGNYWRAPTLKQEYVKVVESVDDEGCGKVALNMTEVAEMTNKTATIQAFASFTEAVTGVQLNATWEGNVQYTPFTIEFGGSSEEHIIGQFPYVGEVSVLQHDKAPLADIPLEICVKLYTSLDKLRDYVNTNSYRFYSFSEDEFYALSQKLAEIKFDEACSNHTTDANGKVKFAVPLYELPANVTKMGVHVIAVNHPTNHTTGIYQPRKKLEVSLTHSNTSSALTVYEESITPKLTCGKNEIKVYFSAVPNSNVELNYYVSSGGALLFQGSENLPTSEEDLESEFLGEAETISFDTAIPEKTTVLNRHVVTIQRPFKDEGLVTDKIKVLVFTRDQEGNILTTTKEMEAESCADQPGLDWNAEKLRPGDAAELKITGKPEAFCGYSVVDKSVDLVPNENSITQPKIQSLREKIAERRVVNDKVLSEGCENGMLLFKAFERLGLFILSDQLLIDTTCDTLNDVTNQQGKDEGPYPRPVPIFENEFLQDNFEADRFVQKEMPIQAAQFALGAAPPQAFSASSDVADRVETISEVKENAVELRDYFPETWLFDMINLDAEGNGKIEMNAPHTITEWVAEVICMDGTSGLGISNKSSVLVTQDFFADIYLPYSVKRGEIFPVNVSVFNTVERQLPMKLTIQESEDFKAETSTSDVCLDAKDSSIKTFNIEAKELNEVNITVQALITAQEDGACGVAGEAEGFSDNLVKPILVKPEGFPVEKVQSVFECKNNADEKTQVQLEELVLPEDLVEGSERAWFMITGDIMAPALANLDSLVQLPTGCGEQNMIGMAPNVYLMEYMQGSGKLDPKLEVRAKQNMKTGFEREQEFRHEDGSYSVWGPKDGAVGSIWLTSFVTKVFSQASKFVDLDQQNIGVTLRWIMSKQNEDGSFAKSGYVIHQELAGSDQSLTSSIFITILEAYKNKVDQIHKMDVESLEKTLVYLQSNLTAESDIYSKSLATYAFTLFNEVRDQIKTKAEEAPQAVEFLNQLIEAANTSIPGQLYWSTEEDNKALAVEMTAYNILSLTMQGKLPEALKAVRWLATQRNSQGGFVSTQDTIVALQALAHYSLKVKSEETNLNLALKENEVSHDLALTPDNLLLLQKQKLATLPTQISADITGKGCFMIQTVLRYNVKESPEKNSFTLSAKIEDAKNLNICASYTGTKEKTNMAVIEIELLSGFSAYESSIEALINEVEAPVKRYEYDGEKGHIVLYFDEIPKTETCWKIELKQVTKIEELKAALVKIYDYYNQEDKVSVDYNLSTDRV